MHLLDLSSLSAQLPQTLRQDGMSEMVRRVQVISIHSAQVLNLELNQALSEILLVSQTSGKRISFVLEFSGHDVHQELQDSVNGSQDIAKDEESDDGRHALLEAEGLEQRPVVDEQREHDKDSERVELCRRVRRGQLENHVKDFLTCVTPNCLVV